MINYIPLVGAIASGIFMVLLIKQYLERRKTHQLLWSVGVTLWFILMVFEFLSAEELVGGNVWMYKLFYVLAAVTVGFMGAGSLSLFAGKPWATYFTAYVIMISIALLGLGLTASIDESLLVDSYENIEGGAGGAMTAPTRYLTPLLTVPGGILLIGIALYSFWKDRSKWFNLFIAGGAFLPTIGGAMARAGDNRFFYAFDTIGIILLSVGFYVSMTHIKKREEAKTKDEPEETEMANHLNSD
jgi:hypothetical protein